MLNTKFQSKKQWLEKVLGSNQRFIFIPSNQLRAIWQWTKSIGFDIPKWARYGDQQIGIIIGAWLQDKVLHTV